jgi:hypothetical protein
MAEVLSSNLSGPIISHYFFGIFNYVKLKIHECTVCQGRNWRKKIKKIHERYQIWPDTFFLLGHPEIFINKFYIFKNYHFP